MHDADVRDVEINRHAVHAEVLRIDNRHLRFFQGAGEFSRAGADLGEWALTRGDAPSHMEVRLRNLRIRILNVPVFGCFKARFTATSREFAKWADLPLFRFS